MEQKAREIRPRLKDDRRASLISSYLVRFFSSTRLPAVIKFRLCRVTGSPRLVTLFPVYCDVTHNMPYEAQWGSRSIVILIMTSVLDRVGGKRIAPSALPKKRWPGKHCTRGWLDPAAGLAGCGEVKSVAATGVWTSKRPAHSASLYR